MSITDFINKIKGIKKLDNFVFLYIFILIFVGISTFNLGRLSVERVVKSSVSFSQEEPILTQKSKINQINNQESKNTSLSSEKRYLASKNGKLYYTVGCSGAKRIAEKNIIWFSTSTEAELAGYKASSSCNK